MRTATVVIALLAASLPGAQAAWATAGGASAPSEAAPASTGRGHAATVRPTGIATWFGPGFYGSTTACGQTLTPVVEGVANRTLPCGTLIKVGYKGRTLVVPVLDRGPYSHIGASWDLTAGAAQKLGITETVRIRTSIVGRAANSPTLGTPPEAQTSLVAGGALAG